MVRPRVPAARRRLRELADQPGAARPPLRRGREDDRGLAIPLHRHPQDARDARGGRGQGPRLHAAAARRHLRPYAGRAAGAARRAAAPRLRQRARAAPPDLPALRRMRPRLQRGLEEHPRPHLPVCGEARRRGPAHPPRGQGVPAARRWRLRGDVRRPYGRPTARSPTTCPGGRSPASAWCSPPAPSARRTCCCATSARCRRSARGARYPVLRQRRPAHLPAQRQDAGSAAGAEREQGAGDHQRHPGRRRSGWRRLPGARPLHPGRGLPLLHRLAGRGGAGRAERQAVREVRLAADPGPGRRLARLHHRRRHRRADRRRRALDGSLPLLGMGRDVPDGVCELRDGRLSVDWFTDTSRSSSRACAAP